ncbi:MAG: RHS repeat-associated core domain-containing protein, partial [Candidatus Hydrogenedentes bacterium]|nr:RHS repeat-associated core domain-containing protein [Candidatus Hydrogenedentota bacterium]
LEQRDNTTATWFRWSGLEECGEYAGTVGSWTIGALQTGYVPGLATFAGSNPSTAEWRYHLTDHLGSVRQLSGQTKAALARYDYAPYGELLRSAGLPLTVGYTGHLWDSAIGQYYAPFRYYNPQTARWNMRDPLGFVDGPNVYAYVGGSPMVYSDRYGLDLGQKLCQWFKELIFGESKGPIGEQVDNALGTAADAGVEVILNGTPGLPPGASELVDVAELAPQIANIGIRRLNFVESIDSLANDDNRGYIPRGAGGDFVPLQPKKAPVNKLPGKCISGRK